MVPAGLVLINKPKDITSFSALYPIKKTIYKKVGHTGTLDRFAEGLLIALIGPMTRMNSYFTDYDKVYEAIFRFGIGTATLDPEGKIIAEGPIPTRNDIVRVIPEFIGKIEQIPPKFSAIHVNGVRAYKSALAGKELELQSRPIDIFSFEVICYTPPDLTVRIHCSKGTYIRSLARDLGKRLSTCAYVTSLCRTKIGPFELIDAVDPNNATLYDLITPWDIFNRLGTISSAVIEDPLYVEKIGHGHLLERTWCESLHLVEDSKLCAIFTPDKRLLGVVKSEVKDGKISFVKYKFIISEDQG